MDYLELLSNKHLKIRHKNITTYFTTKPSLNLVPNQILYIFEGRFEGHNPKYRGTSGGQGRACRWAVFSVGRQANTEKYVFLLILASTLQRLGLRVLCWNCFNFNKTDIISSIAVH